MDDYTLEDLQRGLQKAQAAGDAEAVSSFQSDIQNKYTQGYGKAADAGDLEAAESIAADYRQGRSAWNREATKSDPLWINNAKTLYSEVEKKPYEGDDAGAAEWLKGYMSDFNYRLLGTEKIKLNGVGPLRNTVGIAQDVKNFSPKGKAAFLTAMDDFDQLPTFSQEGAMEAGKRIVTDPSTYIGATTFGIGSAGAKGAQLAAKEGIKQLIRAGTKQFAKATAVGAAEGAIYSGVSDVAHQEAEIGAGRGDEIDLGRTAEAAGTGAAVGALGGAVGGTVSSIRNHAANKIEALGSDRINTLGKDLASMEAEGISDLQKVKESPTTTSGRVSVVQANAQAKRYLTDSQNLVKKSSLPKEEKERILALIDQNNSRVLTADDLASISNTPEGRAVAANVQKRQLLDQKTSRFAADTPARNAIRAIIDLTPTPTFVKEGMKAPFKTSSRDALINDNVLEEGLDVAQNVLKRTGPSSATQGLEDLADSAATQSAREAANRAAKAQASLQRGAQKLAERDQRQADRQASRAATASDRQRRDDLLKEGVDLKQDNKLSQDWIDKNRANLSAGQLDKFRSALKRQNALEKAKSPSGNPRAPLAPRAPQSSRTGPLTSAEFPNAGIKVEGGYKEPGTQVRDRILHEKGTKEIQSLQDEVISKASQMPEGPLRTAHEQYIAALKTYAKNKQSLRDEALDQVMEHLDPDDQDILYNNVRELDERFKVVSAKDAGAAVRAAKAKAALKKKAAE